MNDIRPRARGEVQVGDVYNAKGPGPKYWVIVSVNGNAASALGINIDGEIVSATRYNLHAYEGRDLLGRCEDVANMKLNIEWCDGAAP